MTPLWELEHNAVRRAADKPFTDTMEMAGHLTAAIVTYGVAENGGPAAVQRAVLSPAANHSARYLRHPARLSRGGGAAAIRN